jgi:hypothetical protein
MTREGPGSRLYAKCRGEDLGLADEQACRGSLRLPFEREAQALARIAKGTDAVGEATWVDGSGFASAWDVVLIRS